MYAACRDNVLARQHLGQERILLHQSALILIGRIERNADFPRELAFRGSESRVKLFERNESDTTSRSRSLNRTRA